MRSIAAAAKMPSAPLTTVQRGQTTATAAATAARESSEAEKNACSIDAMLNGGTCEAC
jgi:hypothetical protein